MNSPGVSRVLLAVAVVLTLIPLSLVGMFSDPDFASPPVEEFSIWISLISLAILMILSGLFISGWRWPIAGGVLGVLGAILMGVMFLWFAPMWANVLIISAIGILRARRFAHARRLPS